MYLYLCFDDYLCGHQWIESPKLPLMYKATPKYDASLDGYIFSEFFMSHHQHFS